MNHPEKTHHSPDSVPEQIELSQFADALNDLLPGARFNETVELTEAHDAILEALHSVGQHPELTQSAWTEYARLCEQIVDTTATDMQHRALLQICFIVHKALIFRQTDDMQRYLEELATAYKYAYNMRFDAIAGVIGQEIDRINPPVEE